MTVVTDIFPTLQEKHQLSDGSSGPEHCSIPSILLIRGVKTTTSIHGLMDLSKSHDVAVQSSRIVLSVAIGYCQRDHSSTPLLPREKQTSSTMDSLISPWTDASALSLLCIA